MRQSSGLGERGRLVGRQRDSVLTEVSAGEISQTTLCRELVIVVRTL